MSINIKAKVVSWTGAVAALVPAIAFAQTTPDLGYFDTLIFQLDGVLTTLVPVLIGVALVVFIWGVIRYVTAGESDEKKVAARGIMIYGIIGLFVIVSIWGLVEILQNITGATGTTVIPPTLP